MIIYNINLVSWKLCTIVLPWSIFEYQKLPIGLWNSPDIFQEKPYWQIHPNLSKPFVIHMETSKVQLGAVISQDNKPIAFYSRKLNPVQDNDTTTERECRNSQGPQKHSLRSANKSTY